MSEFFKELRLDYISWKLHTGGEIRRSDIKKAFDISTAIASRDLKEFMRLYPSPMRYDATKKVYVRHKNGRKPRRDRPGLAAALGWE